jgi:hypothetical protein
MLRTYVRLLLPLVVVSPAAAQDFNIIYPIPVVERRMRDEPLTVLTLTGSRMPDDRTQRVTLVYPDSSVMLIKWAKSAPGGSDFNNEPRYEVAAYEIQKMFLDEPDYVVPPTVMRAVPLDWLRQHDPIASPTFREAESVLLVVQYWLSGVTPDDFWEKDRLERDSVYARHLADFNILTYLIRHNDSNTGNFLISQNVSDPRVFSVDNGLAFRSERSNRGFYWRDLRVDRLPRATVDRLRTITREQLEQRLATLAQYEVRDDRLVAVAAGESTDRNRGVRMKNGILQLGLTNGEIGDVMGRIESLLKRVDEGKITTF